MKNPFLSLFSYVVLAACALTLGSCSRAEYAMLPKGSSYHGVSQAAKPASAEPVPVALTPAPAAALVASSQVTAVPVAAAEPASRLKTTTANVVAIAPVVTAQPEALAATTRPVAKPGFAQRLLLDKVVKKTGNMVRQNHLLKQHSNTASTARLDGSLRTALVVLLIGVIIAAFSGVSGLFAIVGGILVIVGLVLLLLYLLDKA